MSAKVFISYSREDELFAGKIQESLEEMGYRVFIDIKEIAPAEELNRRIKQLIVESDAVVFALSPEKRLFSALGSLQKNTQRMLSFFQLPDTRFKKAVFDSISEFRSKNIDHQDFARLEQACKP